MKEFIVVVGKDKTDANIALEQEVRSRESAAYKIFYEGDKIEQAFFNVERTGTVPPIDGLDGQALPIDGYHLYLIAVVFE